MTRITEFTEQELKDELQKRRIERNVQSLLGRLSGWVFCYLCAWSLILLGPIWFPFWFAYKIHQDSDKTTKEILE